MTTTFLLAASVDQGRGELEEEDWTKAFESPTSAAQHPGLLAVHVDLDEVHATQLPLDASVSTGQRARGFSRRRAGGIVD
jgi:hypothetical protein